MNRKLLERVIAGELAANHPDVLAAAAADPVFRAELEELREMQQMLDAEAREQEEILREIQTTLSPGEERVAQALRHLDAQRRGLRADRRVIPWPRWAAAAAAAVALSLGLHAILGPPAEPAPTYLGRGGLHCVEPAAGSASTSWGPFRWRTEQPASTQHYFRVRVIDPASSNVLVESGRLERLSELRWEPSSGKPESQQRLRWEVEQRDRTTGREVGFDSVEFRYSPR